jgi:hypothetical protein
MQCKNNNDCFNEVVLERESRVLPKTNEFTSTTYLVVDPSVFKGGVVWNAVIEVVAVMTTTTTVVVRKDMVDRNVMIGCTVRICFVQF